MEFYGWKMGGYNIWSNTYYCTFLNDPNFSEELGETRDLLNRNAVYAFKCKDGSINEFREDPINQINGEPKVITDLKRRFKKTKGDHQIYPVTVKQKRDARYAILKDDESGLYYVRAEGFFYAKEMGLNRFFTRASNSRVLVLPEHVRGGMWGKKQAALLQTFGFNSKYEQQRFRSRIRCLNCGR